MKNENMVRTVHNVKRIVTFNGKEEALRFIDLYKDLFYYSVTKDSWNRNGYVITNNENGIEVAFTIKKSVFDGIAKHLGLKKRTNAEWIYV